jgi:hypothetical protein
MITRTLERRPMLTPFAGDLDTAAAPTAGTLARTERRATSSGHDRWHIQSVVEHSAPTRPVAASIAASAQLLTLSIR